MSSYAWVLRAPKSAQLEVALLLSVNAAKEGKWPTGWRIGDEYWYASDGAAPCDPRIEEENCTEHSLLGRPCCFKGKRLVWRPVLSSSQIRAMNYDLEMELLELDLF